jgi:DNA-binding HxlR family transcriptional regulator
VKYGQFCPIAKASEVLGERWTLLVVRELATGSTRYKDLQRGLGRISPSVLSSRLKALVEHGIVEKVESDVAHGSEYRLTRMGNELSPIIEGVAVWGQLWVRSRMNRAELDVELLMLRVQQNFDTGAFPQEHGVVAIVFSDLHGSLRRWWLLVDDGRLELCAEAPGRKEDVTLTCGRRTLARVFTGESTLKAALAAGLLEARGSRKLTGSVQRWLRPPALSATLRQSSR